MKAKQGSWFDRSRNWIHKQEQDNPGLTRDQLKKHCSKNYPFLERKGYAYKAFCRAMAEKFGSRKPANSPQNDMFD